MKIELTTDRVGPTCTDSAGDVIDVSADEARRMISSGQAVPVNVVETAAVAPARETRVGRRNPQPRNRNHHGT